MSVKEQNPAIRSLEIAKQRSSMDYRTASGRDTPHRTHASVERIATDLKASHTRGKQDGGLLQHATELVETKTMRQGKSSKPQSDLKPFCVDSPPKRKDSAQKRSTRLPPLGHRQRGIENQKLQPIHAHQTCRNTSESLTPLTSEGEDPEVTRNRNTMTEVRQKQLADMDLSAKRPTPRTYGKVRTMQTNKLSRKIGDEEERSSNYVGSDPALHTKRKADSQSKPFSESDISQTSEPNCCWSLS